MPDEPNKPAGPAVNPPARPAVAPVKPDAKADAKADDDADPYAGSPYTGPSEIIEGGQYVTGTRSVRGKNMGGRIVNAHGETLAWFDDDDENTGRVSDGHSPDRDHP